MTNRRLNIIIFRPNLCGFFLQFLFGQDPSVYSLCGGGDRGRFYSFRDIRRIYGSWVNHHWYHGRRFGWAYQQIGDFVNNTDHPLAVISIHPIQLFQRCDLSRARELGIDVHYYLVQCSPELKTVVSDQFIASGTFTDPRVPIVRLPIVGETLEEVEYYHQAQSLQPLEYIDLDLIVNPLSFYSEYVRVAESMGVAVQDSELIMDYYNTWRNQRFQGLST